MTTAATEANGVHQTRWPNGGWRGSLEDLAAMDMGELETLYCEAAVPDLQHLDGDLAGRMLEVTFLPGMFRPMVRSWARSSSFPWQGKSFRPLGPGVGRGINRVLGDRFKWYPFLTSVGPSRAGNFDAVQLDYDLPENPFFIRAIKDEIRELRPGLYLGQAYVESAADTHLVLYFALEQTT